MAEEIEAKKEEVKVEATVEASVEATAEAKPQETKPKAKSDKKAPAKGKKRPFNGKRKNGAAPAKKPAVFSDSLEERFPALAAKLKKRIEDGIKQKIKDAQKDPKVKAASEKFASEK